MSTSLSAPRQQVLSLIAAGSSVTAAAAAAGIHRNTIFNWLRSVDFRQALEEAEYDRAVAYREQAASQAADAYAAIRAILADSAVPAGVRLKAALAIVDRAAAPLPLPPAPSGPPAPENPVEVHNFAQSAPPDHPKPALVAPREGRNARCPCGSGMKFKRCCLGKSDAQAPGWPSPRNTLQHI